MSSLTETTKIHKDLTVLLEKLTLLLFKSPTLLRDIYSKLLIEKVASCMSCVRVANKFPETRERNLDYVVCNMEDLKSLCRVFTDLPVPGKNGGFSRAWTGEDSNAVSVLIEGIIGQAVKWKSYSNKA